MGLFDDWHHCPRCGAEIEPRDGRVECTACGYVAYANAAPASCAICVDDEGRVLLTRRRWEPYAGMWDLPGGFLGEDEHPLDALRRELSEETGLEVEPDEWFGAFLVPYGEGPGGEDGAQPCLDRPGRRRHALRRRRRHRARMVRPRRAAAASRDRDGRAAPVLVGVNQGLCPSGSEP